MIIRCRDYTVFTIEVLPHSGPEAKKSLLLTSYDEAGKELTVLSTEGFDSLLDTFFKHALKRYEEEHHG